MLLVINLINAPLQGRHAALLQGQILILQLKPLLPSCGQKRNKDINHCVKVILVLKGFSIIDSFLLMHEEKGMWALTLTEPGVG